MSEDFSFSIRQAARDDIPMLVEMKQKLQKHMDDNNKNLWGIQRLAVINLVPYYEQQIINPDVCLIVAIDDSSGRLIGMALGKIKYHEEYLTGRSGRIDDVWVEPACRLHGICEAMFSHLIEFFRQKGIRNLVLEYAIYNKDAENTWNRLGFTPSLVISTAHIDEL